VGLSGLLVSLPLAALVVSAVVTACSHRAAMRGSATECPERDDGARSLPARCRLLATECGALWLLLLAAPFGIRTRPGGTAEGDASMPVLLVPDPGFPAASLRWLGRRLRRDGWPSVHVVTGGGRRSGHGVAAVAAAIARVRGDTGARGVAVVAHGAGGLVTRALLLGGAGDAGIARLVTLGTPHHGTRVPWAPPELRPGSALVSRLASEATTTAAIDCVSIYSLDDGFAAPPDRGYWPGALNIEIRDVGHASLVLSRRVYELVREQLAAPLRCPS